MPGDRVAVQHPVPHLLARAERRPLGRLLDPDVLQSGLDQPLPQDFRIGNLELERRRIVWEARELRSDGFQRADEEVEELELRREAVGDDEHASAGFVTRTISRSARGWSGTSMTPNCDAVTSKLSSGRSSA